MVAKLDALGAIRAACERFQVVRLDVFGSALRDDFEPGRSDIDLLVDFGAMSPYEKPDAYFGLLDERSRRLVSGREPTPRWSTRSPGFLPPS